MVQAENSFSILLMKKELKVEKPFNIDKLYQPCLFSLETIHGSAGIFY
jgi:hypothetical protein